MSIEKLLGELIDAINTNTETHKKAIAALTGGKPSPSKAKPADDDEDAEEKPKAKAAAKGKASTAKKPKAPSEEELRDAFGEFLGTDDEDEKKERKKYVADKILKKFKVTKVTELAAEDRAAAIALLDGYEPEEDEDDDDIL